MAGGYSDSYPDGYLSRVDYLRDYGPNQGTTVAAASTPTSLSELFAASDPAQALIDIMGHGTKPTSMWLCNEASGATDIVGSNNLTDAGSPSKEVADATLGVNCTATTANGAESMDAANASVLDLGDESMAILWIGRLTANNAGNYNIVGKRESTGDSSGYALRFEATNELVWVIDVGAITVVKIEVDHGTTNPQTFLGINDHNADVCGVYSREGSGTSTARTGDAGSTEPFSFGQTPLRNAAAVNHALGAIWIGAAAEGITGAMRLAVAQQLGLEP